MGQCVVTRGWTLQEMIPPRTMSLYDMHWNMLGTKYDLADQLRLITGVPEDILRIEREVHTEPVGVRMSWTAKRMTARIEDRAYSLMGLFGVNMPMLYGEGAAAFRRLQEEIIELSTDTSIFLWNARADQTDVRGSAYIDFLASSPSDFDVARDAVARDQLILTRRSDYVDRPAFAVTNAGLSIEFALIPWCLNLYLALLDCQHERSRHEPRRLCIFLAKIPDQTQVSSSRLDIYQS